MTAPRGPDASGGHARAEITPSSDLDRCTACVFCAWDTHKPRVARDADGAWPATAVCPWGMPPNYETVFTNTNIYIPLLVRVRMISADWADFQFTIYGLLSAIGSVATASTVAIAIVKYVRSRDNEKKRASRNLYLELDNILDGLDDKKYKDDFYNVRVSDRDGEDMTVYFMNRRLNHDFYDSLLYSGMINFLEPDIQQAIQDTFKRVKMHNEFLNIALEIMDQQSNGKIPNRSFKYYIWMDKNEVRLKNDIPKIKERLRQSFKNIP